MAELVTRDNALYDLFWQSLEGTDFDLDELKAQWRPESSFEDLGLDSLDVTDFFLRLEDHFQVKIRQEEYADLASIRAIESYLEKHQKQAAVS